MGIKDWFEKMLKKNQGFVYKLDQDEQQPATNKSHNDNKSVSTHYNEDEVKNYMTVVSEEETRYEEDEDEVKFDVEFDKEAFLQRSVPIDHIVKICVSTYYDEDDEADEYEDIEYAYFLTNYKVSTIVKEAGNLTDIKCLQLTGDDMGTVYDDCSFDVYEDDKNNCHSPLFIISWEQKGMYGYSYNYYYMEDKLQDNLLLAHTEIISNMPTELIDATTNSVKIVGLVQLANGLNLQANNDKYSRRDSLASEKKEVEMFFGSDD